MNKFILLTAVLATVAQAFPNALLDQLFKTKRQIMCSGDASEDMMTCVEPLEFLSHPTSGMAMDDVETPEELDYVCGEMHTAKECVMAVHAQCGQGDMISELLSETVVRVVNFMCLDSNRDVILNNKACWENKQLESAIENCGNKANPNGSPCGEFAKIRSCIKNEVKKACNNDAANFIDGVLYHAIDPMASGIFDCNLSQRIARSLWKMLPNKRK